MRGRLCPPAGRFGRRFSPVLGSHLFQREPTLLLVALPGSVDDLDELGVVAEGEGLRVYAVTNGDDCRHGLPRRLSTHSSLPAWRPTSARASSEISTVFMARSTRRRS